MKFCVYGAGVIGSIFAAKLALTGNDVTVIARGKRLQELRSEGIRIVDPNSKREEYASVNCTETLEPDDRYDYVIVAMQRTQVDAVLPALSRNCSANIVSVVNTAGGYEGWKTAIGEHRLMIGFPSAGGERKNGGVHYFIGKGVQRAFQTTTFGEYSGEKSPRVETLIRLFCRAGIPTVFCKNMDAWQKTHVALVTNIANALYGVGCDNKKLGHSNLKVEQMVKGIQEGRRVLRKIGVKPTPSKLFWLDFPVPLLSLFFAILMRTKLAETTMAKHCIAAKPEMIVLQNEFDELILRSEMDTPMIDILKRNLELS
jgi:2-dehydropantoate 2-reductase